MEEVLDIYTREGVHLGARPRSECHHDNPGFYHKPVWIWIVNDEGKFLLQKRSMAKKRYPGLWDIPSAGHLNAGEASIDGAVRETKEELGVDTDPRDYRFLCEYIMDDAWEIAQVYLLKLNKKINEMNFQKAEVETAQWFSFDDFKKIIHSDMFVPYDDEFIEISIKTLRNSRH